MLLSIMNGLHEKSRGLNFDLRRSDDFVAEVTNRAPGGKRHIVDLEAKACTCSEWQVCGKPCAHVICFISSLRGVELDTYVSNFYSVSKFKAAYALRIPALTDSSQWPKDTLDFFLYALILTKSAGRPKNQRYREDMRGRARARVLKVLYQCPICKGYGYRWTNCKEANLEAKEAYAMLAKEN